MAYHYQYQPVLTLKDHFCWSDPCRLRVSSFSESCPPPPPARPPTTTPPLRQLRAPDLSGHCRTSIASARCHIECQIKCQHIYIYIYGYGSIPIDTFLVGWTSIYQLFWCSLGTRVLTHPHIYIIIHIIYRYNISAYTPDMPEMLD